MSFRNCVSSRYCVLLLLILYAYNREHQSSCACNLVVQILCAFISQLVCLLCRASDNLVPQILFASTSQFASSQFRTPDFVCFYFSICKFTISSSRFCVILLFNLQAHNFELQKSRACNLVVNILYSSTSQFVHLILALHDYTP